MGSEHVGSVDKIANNMVRASDAAIWLWELRANWGGIIIRLSNWLFLGKCGG